MRDGWSLPAVSAAVGGAVWLALALFVLSGGAPVGALEILFLAAPLIIVPLGFSRGDSPSRLLRIATLLQPGAAALVLASFGFERGAAAAAIASGWLLIASLAGLSGLLEILRRPWRLGAETCSAAGLLYLTVGSGWLVMSRWGATPFGFGEPIVLLTAVHFHYAGFAALLVAAGTLRQAAPFQNRRRVAEIVVAAGTIAGPALVAAGFLTSHAVSLGATLLLAACLCLLAILIWSSAPAVEPRLARTLLRISAASIAGSMVLAVVYAWGEVGGVLSIPRMVLFHGTLNGLGFAGCGLLGWNLATTRRVQTASPAEA